MFSCFPFLRVRARREPVGLIPRRGNSRRLVPLLTAVLGLCVSTAQGAPPVLRGQPASRAVSPSATSPASSLSPRPSSSEPPPAGSAPVTDSAAEPPHPPPEPPIDYQGGAFFHPDLERALAEWSRSSGGPAYTALRELWQTWDRAEPAQVEEALHEASVDRRSPAPLRAYAELLVAYARLRRGDGKEAQTRIRALGYAPRFSLEETVAATLEYWRSAVAS